MYNELLWVCLLVGYLIATLLVFRFFGSDGLAGWMVLSLIVANIQVLKTISLFGTAVTLGSIAYGGSFLITDIFSELYGKNKARRLVWYGFIISIAFVFLMRAALIFSPHPDDIASDHLEALFAPLPRIAIASMVAYLVSQMFDLFAFAFWKRRFPSHLWLRNNASTILSQLIDTVIFTFSAFLFVFPINVVIEIAITSYVVKVIMAISDTPFLYAARNIALTRKEVLSFSDSK